MIQPVGIPSIVKISHELCYSTNTKCEHFFNNILTCCVHFAAPSMNRTQPDLQMEYWDRARCVINFEKLDAFRFVLFCSSFLCLSFCVHALRVHIFVRCDHQYDVKHSSSFFFPKRRPHTYNGIQIHIHICSLGPFVVLAAAAVVLKDENRLQNKTHELKWKTKQKWRNYAVSFVFERKKRRRWKEKSWQLTATEDYSCNKIVNCY